MGYPFNLIDHGDGTTNVMVPVAWLPDLVTILSTQQVPFLCNFILSASTVALVYTNVGYQTKLIEAKRSVYLARDTDPAAYAGGPSVSTAARCFLCDCEGEAAE